MSLGGIITPVPPDILVLPDTLIQCTKLCGRLKKYKLQNVADF